MSSNESNQFRSYLLDDLINKNMLDLVNKGVGLGSINAGTFSIINGLNMLQGRPVLPAVSDMQVINFFTRPNLNLSYHNIKNSRRLSWLTYNDDHCMANYIRCLLDPPGNTPANRDGKEMGLNVRSKLINDELAFIPLFTNTITSLTGWPEIVAQTYTSDTGIGGEEISFIDGRPDVLNTFDLSATFQNFEGDPILPIIALWVEYAQQVSQDSISPYIENIIENRVDYNTRIFSITLDRTRRFIQHINSTIAFPTNVPYGALFDFSSDSVFNDAGTNINIVFKCASVAYDDPILPYEFNKTVEMFNSKFKDGNKSGYRKVDGCIGNDSELNSKLMLNYKSIPYINLDTLELEWWATEQDFKEIEEEYKELVIPSNKNSQQDNEKKINPFADSILKTEKNKER